VIDLAYERIRRVLETGEDPGELTPETPPPVAEPATPPGDAPKIDEI